MTTYEAAYRRAWDKLEPCRPGLPNNAPKCGSGNGRPGESRRSKWSRVAEASAAQMRADGLYLREIAVRLKVEHSVTLTADQVRTRLEQVDANSRRYYDDCTYTGNVR